MKKKSKQKKGQIRASYIVLRIIFFLRTLSGQFPVDRQYSVSDGGLNLFKKFRRSIFRRVFLSMLLPSFLPFAHRCFGLVHASLITSGRSANWRAEKVTAKEPISIFRMNVAGCIWVSWIFRRVMRFSSHFSNRIARECPQLLLTH